MFDSAKKRVMERLSSIYSNKSLPYALHDIAALSALRIGGCSALVLAIDESDVNHNNLHLRGVGKNELIETIKRLRECPGVNADIALADMARFAGPSITPIAVWQLVLRGSVEQLIELERDPKCEIELRSAISALRGGKPLVDTAFDKLHKSMEDALVASRGDLVHKLKAKDSTGRWAYYFVLVERENETAFLDALKSVETIDLEDYGIVVASNYGEGPDDDSLRYLNSKFDFDV